MGIDGVRVMNKRVSGSECLEEGYELMEEVRIWISIC